MTRHTHAWIAFLISGSAIIDGGIHPALGSDVSELRAVLDRALSEVAAIDAAQSVIATEVADIDSQLRGGKIGSGTLAAFDSGSSLSDAYRSLLVLAMDVEDLGQRIDSTTADLEKGHLIAQTLRDAELIGAYADALKLVDQSARLNKQLQEQIRELQDYLRSLADKSQKPMTRSY